MAVTDEKAVSEAKTQAWMAAFENEPPLHTLFPVTLTNGKTVPGVQIVCRCCGNRISGDRIHGRVTDLLPHVLTVSANGYCKECNRMTHVDCRFRSNAHGTVIEWLAANGCWQARELRQLTFGEKIARGARRLAAWIGKAM